MRFQSFVIRADESFSGVQDVLEKRLRRKGLRSSREKAAPESCAIFIRYDASMPKEGVRVWAENEKIEICAGGKTGALAGAGRMLRACAFGKNGALLPDGLIFEGAPRFALRGMQIGYRALSNANDAWTMEQYTEYIEELALFGANAIEILPDDGSEGMQTLMKHSVGDMNRHIAGVCLRLGLEIWYWLPHKGKFMDCEAEAARTIDSAEEKLAALPHVDHIFIPGADPGDLEPEDLFRFAERVKERAQKRHKDVKMWLSPQVFSFTPERLNGFFEILNRRPEWLDGVVFGPWERDDAFALRRKTPECYPVRNYPDICHSFHCQYPVPEWSGHFARTHGRECINPRPRAMKAIHNRFMNCFIGSVCYSDGVNDDANKFVWLDQEWNPDTDPKDTLFDYARLFLGEEHAAWFRDALFALEEGLSGRGDAQKTYLSIMRHQADEGLCDSWRYQLARLRAAYDLAVQERIRLDEALEARARREILSADEKDIFTKIDSAESMLFAGEENPVMCAEEAEAWDAAERLNRLIGLQSSVPRYGALRWMRAAFMDGLRMQLNDRMYWKRRFHEIRRIDPARALSEARALMQREIPPEGGIYAKMSRPENLKYVVSPHDAQADPGAQESAFIDHSAWGIGRHYQKELGEIMPLAWESGIATLFDVPLVLRFAGLEKERAHRMEIVYFFNKNSPRIHTEINGRVFEDYRAFEIDDRVHIYEIDRELMNNGEIEITLRALEGTVGPGVSEIRIEPI